MSRSNTRGYPPSVREIGEAVGLNSPSSVAHQLKVLRPRASCVGIQPPSGDGGARSRCARDVTGIGDQHPAPVMVPRRRADRRRRPDPGRAGGRGGLPPAARARGDGELFLLRVRGDSMIDAAICDRDFVVVRTGQTAENGADRGCSARRRGHGQDAATPGRSRLAHSRQPGVRADRRRPGGHHGNGRRGAAPNV